MGATKSTVAKEELQGRVTGDMQEEFAAETQYLKKKLKQRYEYRNILYMHKHTHTHTHTPQERPHNFVAEDQTTGEKYLPIILMV